MPVRYPPTEKTQSVVRRRKSSSARIVAYETPGPGFTRRFIRNAFSLPVVIPLVFVTALLIGFFVYYWTVFSGRIDNLLKGEVYTRSAGIYAAPKQLRTGETLSEEDLIGFLKSAGYIEKGHQGDTARGRYAISGSAVRVEPSRDSLVDGQRQFQRIRVQFSHNGSAISSIADLEGNARLEKALLEPELI